MPFAAALFGSLLIHLGLLFGSEWELAGLPGADRPPVVDVVLSPAVVPVPKTRPLAPATKKTPAKRRPVAEAPSLAVPEPAAAPDAPVDAPVEAAATAVPPAPTSGPAPAEPAVAAAPEPAPLANEAEAIALPGKGRMEFQLIRGEQGFIIGRTVHEWEHDGARYRARSVTETTGLAAVFKPARVVMSSEGEVRAAGLRPASFRHEKVKGVDAAAFDWERRLLSYDGKEVALPDGTQDMLSFYFQATFAARPDEVLLLPIATGRKLEHYRFEPKGEELIAVNGKDLQTRHYAARGGADLIELWIAPDQPGLPLKIRFVDHKGDIYDQIAVAIDIKEQR